MCVCVRACVRARVNTRLKTYCHNTCSYAFTHTVVFCNNCFLNAIKADTMSLPMLQLVIHHNDANVCRCVWLWPDGDVSYGAKRRVLVLDPDWR